MSPDYQISKSFRPLTGNYISQWTERIKEAEFHCFRPLTGNYISQWNKEYITKNYNVFPSPYGELHFSMGEMICLDLRMIVSVPLRGTTFLNVIARLRQKYWMGFRPLTGNYISQFASSLFSLYLFRFRPLTGNYISQYYIIFEKSGRKIVSVPLRGTTFLNGKWNH